VEPSRTEPDGPPPGDDDGTVWIDDSDRYNRLRLISWWRQERLAAARVLVVGAGALGNEVLKNLALLGVGRVYLVDFDRVEASNLSRAVLFRAEDEGRPKAHAAAGRARELNPDVRVVPIAGDIITDVGLGLFLDSDLVIGCLDNREARLWVNRQCWKANTPWIDAGIQEIQGVVKVFVPPDSACYECAMTQRDYELLNLRYSCPLLRREDIQNGRVPTAPTIASMIAALQVQEALKILHGLPVAAGSAHVFNGVSNQFYSTRLPYRADCLSHETYPEPEWLPLGVEATLATVFEHVRASERGPVGPLTLRLDRELVVMLECPGCQERTPVFRVRQQVRQSLARCPTCGGERRPELVSDVAERSDLASRALHQLGIPSGDVLRIEGAEATGFYRITGEPSSHGPPGL
jgi:adenylyltransferase/sulfurtransferase